MRLLVIALASALIIPGLAQSGGSGSELAAILSFETEHRGNSPGGWGGGPAGTIVVDGQIVHGGRWSARLERDTASPSGFSTITKSVPMDFAGTRIEWRGFLRAENVSEYVGLWMREDGDTAGLAFDNMQQRQVKGTHDWTEYSITLPVHRDAKQLYFGVLIAGTGKLWADDLQLLVDGKPIWEAPRIERAATAIDLDHEFDGGSHIVLDRLSAAQIENLTRFTYADLDNPGAFRWRGETPTLSPQPPLYSGKIVILVDEVSQSQAEHTAMALRSARQAFRFQIRRSPESGTAIAR